LYGFGDKLTWISVVQDETKERMRRERDTRLKVRRSSAEEVALKEDVEVDMTVRMRISELKSQS
jgi:hypothetical protein